MDDAWLRTDCKEVDKRDDLRKVLGWLRGEHRSRPVVMDGKKPYAILDPRRLMGRGVNAATRLEKVSWPVPCVSPADDAAAVQRKFLDAMAPYLPVRGPHDRLQGYVDACSIADGLEGPSAREAWIEAPCVRVGDAIEAADHVFASTIAPAIPVLDKKGRIEGALMRSDLLRVQEFEDQPMGRKDFGGETIEVRAAPVQGRMVTSWNQSMPHASYDELVASCRQDGYSFVLDEQGRYAGIVTGPALLRRAWDEANPRMAATVAPHFRQA